MSDCLIICTRGRPVELRDCLNALAGCPDLPDEVLIVDSSSDSLSETVVESSRGVLGPRSRVRYIRSAPGLTRQRNVGLDSLGAHHSLVFFIDDDSLVPGGYFDAIRTGYQALPGSAGVGGVVQAPLETSRGTGTWIRAKGEMKRIALRLLAVESRPGAVNRAAVSGSMKTPRRRFEPVDFLSGGAMSFPRSVFSRLRFDEEFLVGYSLGEDLDFSLRAAQFGQLWVAADAKLLHYASPVNRLNSAEYWRMATINRNYFVGKYPKRLSRTAFFWSCFGQIAASFLLKDPARRSGVVRGLDQLGMPLRLQRSNDQAHAHAQAHDQ